MYWGWHPLQGLYLHNWGVASTSAVSTTGGCTFIAGGVHTRTHVYWVGIHYRGCTFITGGAASTSAASNYRGMYLHCWGCAYQDACVLGGGIHYRGCTFITGGWHPPVMHPLQGVYLHCWGCGIHQCCIHYRGCTFITGGWHPPVLHPLQGDVPSLLGVCIPGCMCTGGWHPLQGVYLHNWGVASTSAASTTGGVP